MDEYYKTLGLRRGASQEEIKRAYRKKAMELHPDKNNSANAHEQFVEVTLAYDVLTNGRIVRSKAPRTRTPEEKFRNVHEPPRDPEQFKEWVHVARKRAAGQARMNFDNFKKNNDAFRRSKYFHVARFFAFSVYLAGLLVSLFLSIVPVIIGFSLDSFFALLISALFFIPIGIGTYIYTSNYKKSYNLYFKD